jgi:hypothetical protein
MARAESKLPVLGQVEALDRMHSAGEGNIFEFAIARERRPAMPDVRWRRSGNERVTRQELTDASSEADVFNEIMR